MNEPPEPFWRKLLRATLDRSGEASPAVFVLAGLGLLLAVVAVLLPGLDAAR